MKGNGAMPALVLILALTMACGSKTRGAWGREEGQDTTGCTTRKLWRR